MLVVGQLRPEFIPYAAGIDHPGNRQADRLQARQTRTEAGYRRQYRPFIIPDGLDDPRQTSIAQRIIPMPEMIRMDGPPELRR